MKNKILNDPVFGFINVLEEDLSPIIEHPFFQRLNRIKQLGLTYYVYPGALHTRFHHTLGATHLMSLAINVLRSKGVEVTPDEELSSKQAILLHDIGHGPFSHALERSIVNLDHEYISLRIMDYLSESINLELAMKIFNGEYEKSFLHDLISSNLDVDRLDYLKRDSFFTGVSEGVIGTERIIKMLNVFDNELVVEEKGLHSVENFLIARELMYLQVYLHKTVTIAEQMLISILKRAKHLARKGKEIFATPPFRFFLYNDISEGEIGNKIKIQDKEMTILEAFALLDDSDVQTSIKVWAFDDDAVLSDLSKRLLNRKLSKIAFSDKPWDKECVQKIRSLLMEKLKVDEDKAGYYLIGDKLSLPKHGGKQSDIKILTSSGVLPLSDVTRVLNTRFFFDPTDKHYLIFPHEVKKEATKILSECK